MIDAQSKLLETLQSPRPVEGFTHNFYRYPARFAPEFVREVVLEFSNERFRKEKEVITFLIKDKMTKLLWNLKIEPRPCQSAITEWALAWEQAVCSLPISKTLVVTP